jgi:Uri superfamily endonuclease
MIPVKQCVSYQWHIIYLTGKCECSKDTIQSTRASTNTMSTELKINININICGPHFDCDKSHKSYEEQIMLLSRVIEKFVINFKLETF